VVRVWTLAGQFGGSNSPCNGHHLSFELILGFLTSLSDSASSSNSWLSPPSLRLQSGKASVLQSGLAKILLVLIRY
jgi:hypothetical protein